ncbi:MULTISPECIES: ATP-binding protein [unclassified Rhodococcus (in: high G+C Gram-positive bacteria)]|uniref:ATP-binding protein n=1 Tax=unclassified Rhodococcus (in: high G+C Gram-positive bacteria) TaxID=192944 RepID=UPI0012E39A1F|nr:MULTISPECIES: BREX system ATP-binding domain-containing protein [unclassified Rhodococcus (in: high G+C Gram-positive bacteria)]
MTSDSPASVRLVGAVTVERGSRVVDPRIIGGPRCVELLSYLTLNRHREVSHDELADLLWPEERPRTWNSVLRGVISKVRDVLDAADIAGTSIVSRTGMVRLTLPPDTTVDLEEIRDACRRTEGSPADRARDARTALRLLAEPVLVGAHGAWADDVRREFDDLRLTALEADATASMDLGAFENAVSSAESLLAADPLRESAYRIAMRGYVALGDRGQALGAAARCRAVLADRLGVSPSRETQSLYLELLEDDTETTPAQREEPPVGSAFVGRDVEMSRIVEDLEAAAAGHGRFLLVSGPPGAGKTSLARAVMQRARAAGTDVVSGRCSEHSTIPYEPFVEAVTRDLDSRGVIGARQWLRTNGADILGIIPGAARRFGDLIPPHVDDDRTGASDAVQRWLVGPARQAPTLLVIDDLQWASGTTAALVRHLARSTQNDRLCILATMRDENLVSPELQATLDVIRLSAGFREITLGGLSLAAVHDLLREQNSTLDPEAIVARTGGSALLVAAVIAAHEREPGGSLPFTVTDAVRLASRELSCDAVTLLELCAVTGVTVSRPLLRAASTIPSDLRFAETLDELLAVNFLVAGDTDDELVMRHALVQSTLYDAIPGARRAQMHSDVARALVDLGADTTADELARIAYHFGRALDSDRSEAALYARRAGDAAYAVSAYEDAVVGYRTALRKMVPHGDSRERCRLLIDLGRAQRKCIDRSYRATLFDAIAMARRLGDVDLQVDATLADTISGAGLFQMFDPLPERLDSLHDALHVLEDSGRANSAATAKVLVLLAMELSWTDDWKERRDLLEQAVTLAHSVGDRSALEAALRAMLWCLLVPQCWDLRQEAMTRLVELESTSSRRHRDPSAATILARTQQAFGDLGGADSTLAAVTRADLAGDPEMTWAMVCSKFGVDVSAGRLVRAETVLARICETPDAALGSHTYGREHTSILTLRTMRGDLRHFADRRDEMATMFDLIPAFRPVVASSLADVGRMDEARELMNWYDEQRLAAIAPDMLWLMSMTFIARAGATVGNTLVCTDVYERLLPYAEQTVSVAPSVFGVVHHHLADASLATGHVERAGRHLHAARRLHVARGFEGWSAEDAYLGLRIEHARTGRLAARALASARTRADVIGASAVRRRIDAVAALVENSER